MPAEYYLDTIRTVFQEFSLPKGRMFVREQLVRPQAISKTRLVDDRRRAGRYFRQRPDRVGARLCTGIPTKMREHYLAPGVGHYGIFSGRRFREMLYPRIRDFNPAPRLGKR